MKLNIVLTVFFDGQYWVGVFERTGSDGYEAAKVVFGAEPKDGEIYDFILKHLDRIRFSLPEEDKSTERKAANPKRLQREISKELKRTGAGTKAQEALKLQYECSKAENRKTSKKIIEQVKEMRFEMHRQKTKEKHKGH
ncbi:MAG: YjdF family protein [Bacillota bacterium]|nr:YjdF family protein [Bacillota bacterium]